MFEVEWRGRRVALKASNGRYVCMKKNGQLAAVSDSVGEHSPPAPARKPVSAKSWCPARTAAARRLACFLDTGSDSRGSGISERPHLRCPFGEPGFSGRARRSSRGAVLTTPRHARLAGPGGAAAPQPREAEEFILKLINRPVLVLRGPDGFVRRRRGSNRLDTNRSVYDVFHLSFSDGAYQIRGGGRGRWAAGRGAQTAAPADPALPAAGRGGGFWYTGSHGSVCSDGERAEDFLLELRERGRLAIRARSGKYLRGDASGLLRADADAPAGVALWEY
ncbi:LOW QUALITY PROTEIN: hypothetical protein MC885_015863 [Smutsia gigantea]|nr:LOW QUALITY PROTEIN: hypothetical protein MC885_015863 [Smutsia gigantea]